VIGPSVIVGGVSTTGTSANPLSHAHANAASIPKALIFKIVFFMGLFLDKACLIESNTQKITLYNFSSRCLKQYIKISSIGKKPWLRA
jgi:hypothetical protein